ncbi:MAG: ASCH domain-containing protein [Candidatus Aminicenantes bacterium]|nr:ASCH domain-containing protein [Candidatus Aminicenantes bacterium]
MKALSLIQPYASLIAIGKKTIETRAWSTKYRGKLLIVSSKKSVIKGIPYTGLLNFGLPFGKALAIAELIDCRPMKTEDEEAAIHSYRPGLYAWILSNIKKIEQFPVRGQLKLFEVDYEEES